MKIYTLTVCLFFSFFAIAQVHVKGYYRSNGTYVAPHTRSSPNSTPTDNYSYPSNTNPYTGKTATGNPDTYTKNQSNSTNSTSISDVWVNGYYRSDGTYVQGCYRSAPDGNTYNNYSFPGNTNPYTGNTATVNTDTYLKNYYSDTMYLSGSTYYVSSNTLNIRSGPSTNNSVIVSLNKGDKIEVLETVDNTWKKVKVYGITGYVYSGYISLTNPTSTYFDSSFSIINYETLTSSESTVKNTILKAALDTSSASKDDTEKWILSKLQKYTPDRYYNKSSISLDGSALYSTGTYFKNFLFYFDQYNLVVEYQEELSSSMTERRELFIPIYDIKDVFDYIGNILFITDSETIMDRNLTTNKQSTEKYFSIQFDVKAETNLCGRISKAFQHLKKFYRKPVSNEPF